MVFDRAILKILQKAHVIMAIVIAVIMTVVLVSMWSAGVVDGQLAATIWCASAVVNSILAGIVEYWERGLKQVARNLKDEGES